MSQNELQRVVAELDELIARDEEQQDYCSETGPNEAMRRVVALIGIRRRLIAAASRIEAAQAVAPGGGEVLARGWFHPLPADAPENLGTRDDYEFHDIVNIQTQPCEKCIPATIVREHIAAAPAPASEAKGQDDLCCPACEVTGFTIPIQHTEEMSFGRVIGLEADYCTNCGEAFVLPEKALRNEVKFNHARNHKPAASSAEESEELPVSFAMDADYANDAEQEQAKECPERLAEWVESAHEAFAMPDEELEGKLQQAAALLRRGARVEVDELARFKRALAEYPAKNPQQMQARKVCLGVIELSAAYAGEKT